MPGTKNPKETRPDACQHEPGEPRARPAAAPGRPADGREALPALSAAPGAGWRGAGTELGGVLGAVPCPSLPCHRGLTHAVCSSPSEGGGAGLGAAAAEAGLTQWAGGAWGPRAGQDGPPPFAWGLSAGHLASRSPRVTAGRVSTATYRLFSLTHRRPPAVTTTGEDRGAHTPDAARPDGGALPGPGRASAWSSVPCEP